MWVVCVRMLTYKRRALRGLYDTLIAASRSPQDAAIAERLLSGKMASSSGTISSSSAQPLSLVSLQRAYSSLARSTGKLPITHLPQRVRSVRSWHLFPRLSYSRCRHHRTAAFLYKNKGPYRMIACLQVENVAFATTRKLFSSEPPPKKGEIR